MEWKFIEPVDKKEKKGKKLNILEENSESILSKILSDDYDHVPTKFKIPERYVPTRYLDAYNLFFKFENFLRLFVFYVLKARFGTNWSDFQFGDNADSKISAIYKKRSGISKKYEYIGRLSENPIMYLTLDELIKIMLKKKNLFGPYFVGSLEALKEKFTELIITRNNLAHFREITKKDISRALMILEDLNPSLISCYKNLFPKEKDFIKYNFKENEKLMNAWQFLIENCKYLKISLFINKNKNQFKLQVNVPSEVIGTKFKDESAMDELEKESIKILDYLPNVIEYINVDINRLYEKLENLFPYLTHFTYTKGIEPLQEKDGDYAGEYRGKVGNFGIYLYSEFNQLLNNYENYFITLKDILDIIENDFQQYKVKSDSLFSILNRFKFSISLYCFEYRSSYELPRELYIEDWSNADLGSYFLDFSYHPWIQDQMAYDDTE